MSEENSISIIKMPSHSVKEFFYDIHLTSDLFLTYFSRQTDVQPELKCNNKYKQHACTAAILWFIHEIHKLSTIIYINIMVISCYPQNVNNLFISCRYHVKKSTLKPDLTSVYTQSCYQSHFLNNISDLYSHKSYQHFCG